MTTDTRDPMSPDASPGELTTRSGVRRVNDLPLYLAGGGLAIFVGIVAVVAADRAAQQDRPVGQASTQGGGASSVFANQIVGGQTGGIIPAQQAVPPAAPEAPGTVPAAPAGPSIPIARPGDLDAPPVPPRQPAAQQGLQRSPADDQAERIRLAKWQMFEEAVKAKTGVSVAQRNPAGGPAQPAGLAAGPPASRQEAAARLAAVRQRLEAVQRDDPTAAYQARLQQLQAAGLAPGTGAAAGASAGVPGGAGLPGGAASVAAPVAPPLQPAAGPSTRNDAAQFAGDGQADRWRLDARPEAPRSPYELRAGFVIPATLMSGINSSLPGQIMAQVSANVYDTATGRHLLVPQGARLVGRYASEVAYGQRRVFVAWQRIVFPDGKALDIGAMPGADSAGFAGFADQVNNHYLRIFGSAFLMSGVTAGIALSQDRSAPAAGFGYGAQTASGALSQAVGQQLGQATAQLIARNLSIAPTIEIRPGYRFNVVVIKDMTFSKPYQAFDY